MLGLSAVVGDIVLAAPASRVHDLSGLALATSENSYISAYRVLLLVKGTALPSWIQSEKLASLWQLKRSGFHRVRPSVS